MPRIFLTIRGIFLTPAPAHNFFAKVPGKAAISGSESIGARVSGVMPSGSENGSGPVSAAERGPFLSYGIR